MKIEISIDLLKDFFASGTTCRHCKYRGTNNCVGKSCNDSQIESLIEKSQLILDFDLAILELKKLKKKCTERQITGLLFAVEKLEEIKEEFKLNNRR
jgi:hypothetical protein